MRAIALIVLFAAAGCQKSNANGTLAWKDGKVVMKEQPCSN